MSIAIHGEDLVRSINRTIMLKQYAYATGRYEQFVRLSRRCGGADKSGSYVYGEQRAKFIHDLETEIKMFCGNYYSNGINPNGVNHPIGMMIAWMHGRPIMATICAGFPQNLRTALVTYDRCRNAGIKINVPPEDLKILESVV